MSETKKQVLHREGFTTCRQPSPLQDFYGRKVADIDEVERRVHSR